MRQQRHSAVPWQRGSWRSGGVAAAVSSEAPWPCLVVKNKNGKATINWWDNQLAATDSAAAASVAESCDIDR